METCDCQAHSGPHWLYLDYQWRKQNIERLQRAFDLVVADDAPAFQQAMMGYLVEEQSRIGEKSGHMKPDKEYPYSLLGPSCAADLPMIAWTLVQSINDMVQEKKQVSQAKGT